MRPSRKEQVTLHAKGKPASPGGAAVARLRGSLKHLKRRSKALLRLTRGEN